MSARQVQPQIAAVHPRETTALFGHRDAETALLNAYRGGRIPHAWLIGGAPGIGKATLAYRMARFVLAHRDAQSTDAQRARPTRKRGTGIDKMTQEQAGEDDELKGQVEELKRSESAKRYFASRLRRRRVLDRLAAEAPTSK